MVELIEITCLSRQTLADIALQEYGAIEGLEYLLFDNQSRLPDGLATGLYAGKKLRIRKDSVIDERIYRDLIRYEIKPATGILVDDPVTGPDYNEDYNIDYNIEE